MECNGPVHPWWHIFNGTHPWAQPAMVNLNLQKLTVACFTETMIQKSENKNHLSCEQKTHGMSENHSWSILRCYSISFNIGSRIFHRFHPVSSYILRVHFCFPYMFSIDSSCYLEAVTPPGWAATPGVRTLPSTKSGGASAWDRPLEVKICSGTVLKSLKSTFSWLVNRPPKVPIGGGWTSPFEKICSSNWIISPGRGENKKYLKPPPRYPPQRDSWFNRRPLFKGKQWGFHNHRGRRLFLWEVGWWGGRLTHCGWWSPTEGKGLDQGDIDWMYREV